MNVVDFILGAFVKKKYRRITRMLQDPLGMQEKVMHQLIRTAAKTQFGRDHFFEAIKDYASFKSNIPIRNYEELTPYIERIKSGQKDVLWPGVPICFGMTAGTTSGAKYIPVTKASLKNQLEGPKYFGVNYAHRYKRFSHLKGNFLLFSDGPVFKDIGVLKGGAISTIVHRAMPKLYAKRSLPSPKVNSIQDFSERIRMMVNESIGKDIRAIVAMPPALLNYLRTMEKVTGKCFKDHFPRFQLLMFSGMNYKPFLPEILRHIPSTSTILESYPSTEGFIAYQDCVEESGMQLVLDNGIFYEFVPADEIHLKNPTRIALADVQLSKNYALVISTNAGLWGYVIGDIVRFKSLFSYRIEITGRIGQKISVFGEQLIVEETDRALSKTTQILGCSVVDYMVAPKVGDGALNTYHEWFIEFGLPPRNLEEFAALLDDQLKVSNINYIDIINRKFISSLKIIVVPKNGFRQFMEGIGKVGMQQKTPHLSNDYTNAEKLKTLLDLK